MNESTLATGRMNKSESESTLAIGYHNFEVYYFILSPEELDKICKEFTEVKE